MTMLRSTKLLALVLMVVLAVPVGTFAQSSDSEPPEITNVQVSEVDDSSVTITWETDEEADSAVNYGLQPNYGMVRVPIAERTTHSITLDNLEPGRVYYFRVVSADENGNQGISADYKVETSGTPSTDGRRSGSGRITI